MSEHQYLSLVGELMLSKEGRIDRTGVGTLSVFGRQLRFDLQAGFPLMTTRKLPFKAIVNELLWFLRGDTNVAWLHDRGVTIWDEWADDEGDLGPIYGEQWRSWPVYEYPGDSQGIDQIRWLVEDLKLNPFSRRHIVSAWNVAELPAMALAPCHVMFQMYVENDGRLSCQVYQRSADVFLGLPFNIASYALLTHMLATVVGRPVGHLIHTIGDAHLYANHVDQARELLSREPRGLPSISIYPRTSIDDFVVMDLSLAGYDPHPAISAPVAV